VSNWRFRFKADDCLQLVSTNFIAFYFIFYRLSVLRLLTVTDISKQCRYADVRLQIRYIGLTLLGGCQSEYCHNIWCEKKLELGGYPMAKKSDDMLSRFDTIHVTDGQTSRDSTVRIIHSIVR